MSRLYKDGAFTAGPSVPTGVTTTYRVITSGSEENSCGPVESPMSPPSQFQQWLRRQHPADVLRILLMLIAVIAVVFAIVHIG